MSFHLGTGAKAIDMISVECVWDVMMIEGRLSPHPPTLSFFFFFFSEQKDNQIIRLCSARNFPQPYRQQTLFCGHPRKKNTRDPALTYELEKRMGRRGECKGGGETGTSCHNPPTTTTPAFTTRKARDSQPTFFDYYSFITVNCSSHDFTT